METQHHNLPNQQEHDGHGGVQVCRKCGWPFPNPHPSSKNRRAHKKVCGTIDKYRLDENAQDKTHVEGHDGEPHSDDEFGTPGEKGVERTLSKRSSSGVGSRSSRSTRSEDEVFTDAVTEFNESLPVLAREASGGILQRYYSMQNENEQDGTKPMVENLIAGGDYSSTTDPLKDSQLETVQNLDGEKDKEKADMASQDHISTTISPVSSSVTSEIGNALDQNIIQSFEPSTEPDIVSERGKEFISSKDESELRISYSETPEGVSEVVHDLKGACNESDGKLSTSFNVLDSYDRDKIGSCIEVDSSGNLCSQVQGEVLNSGNGCISKSEIDEEYDSNIGTNENVYAINVPDVLPLEHHHILAADDLDHLRGKNNFSEALDSPAGIVEYSESCFVEEGGSDIGLTKSTDSMGVFSDGVRVCSVEDTQEGQKLLDEQTTFGDKDHRSGVTSSDADIYIGTVEVVDDLNVKNVEDKKDSFPEADAMDAGETSSNENSIRSKDEDGGKHLTVMDNDCRKVSADDLTVKNSVCVKPTLGKVTLQDMEHLRISGGMGNDENLAAERDILNRYEVSDGATVENVGYEMGPACGMSVAGSYDCLSDSKEPKRVADLDKLDRISDSEDLMVGHPHGESLLLSHCIGGTEIPDKNAPKEECMADNGTYAINLTSKEDVNENAESSCQSPPSINHCSTEKFDESLSCITEGDKVTKQHDTIVDSGSLAGSLDANWGSVSVISATSDAIPTADIVASNHPRAFKSEENPSTVPTQEIENQFSPKQVSVKPDVGTEQMGPTSEIQTAASMSNELDRGKKGKEIVDTVNWDSGKQNTPLKTLLGEATARSRAESPIHHNMSSCSNLNSVPQKSGTAILNSDHSKTETGKEWNSPARYPVNIKTEKRRSKSRPSWASFLCCSSVNAR